jgi:hypothetical protein
VAQLAPAALLHRLHQGRIVVLDTQSVGALDGIRLGLRVQPVALG